MDRRVGECDQGLDPSVTRVGDAGGGASAAIAPDVAAVRRANLQPEDLPVDQQVPELIQGSERKLPQALPDVWVIMKRLPEAVAAARQALLAYNDPPKLFVRDGDLVCLDIIDGRAPLIRTLSPSDLRCELTYAANWYEMGDAGVRPIYPPSLVVHQLMREAAQWAPPLCDVVGVPVVGRDGRLLLESGYHAREHLYYQPDHLPLPPISPRPAAEHVAEARTLLCDELLGDFAFVSDSHVAAAVASMLVPFVRRCIDGPTPLHLFDSPQAGTGKTLLADVVCFPALGRAPAANTEIANGDDLRKWVTAMALAGERVVLIDNVNARLKGSALAAALTKVEWSDRVVGTSRLARGALSCLWLATGNNVTTTPELVATPDVTAHLELKHLGVERRP
jgi:hypothetical protein